MGEMRTYQDRKEYLKRWATEHSELISKWQKERNERYKKLTEEYFGFQCWNCGKECKIKPMRGIMFRHEINNISHFSSYSMFWIHKGRFILLCLDCHRAFHKLIEYGYNFEEILKIFKWSEIEYE